MRGSDAERIDSQEFIPDGDQFLCGHRSDLSEPGIFAFSRIEDIPLRNASQRINFRANPTRARFRGGSVEAQAEGEARRAHGILPRSNGIARTSHRCRGE